VDVPVVAPPDPRVFRATIERAARPVLLRGLANDWRSHRAWSFASLRERIGSRAVPVIGLDDGLLGYGDAGMRYAPMAFDAYLTHLEQCAKPAWFLTVEPHEHLPELVGDLDVPSYCTDAAWRDTRVSVGTTGTITPIHVELAHNLFAVLAGEKEVLMFSPWDSHRMYPQKASSGAPHISPVDPRHDDRLRFPSSGDATAYRCVVREGDVLFLPRGWWHAVRTNAPTIAFSNWWANGAASLVPRAAGLYKRLRAVKT
jgi:lysine-specific demethylase 8